MSYSCVAITLAFWVTVLCSAQSQTNYQRIVSIGPSQQSGSFPRGQLSEGTDGLLYGTTYAGGSSNLGTVFKVHKDGSGFSVLHSFSDGNFPYAGVLQGSDGALYGTTSGGGLYNSGTVFKLDTNGLTYTTLLNFGSTNGDAVGPAAGLTKGNDGAFYGTTSDGGVSNLGAVYRLHTDGGGYAILYSFAGATNNDGSRPFGALCQGGDGAFYGTTQYGGSNNLGTVFKLSLDGSGYQVLHHFAGPASDGRLPLGTLVQGQDGFLYGTTYYGGLNDLGTLFKLDTNGNNYAVLHAFQGGPDGNQPIAGLIRGPGPTLFGATRFGGPADAGVAFSLNQDGSGLTVLHNFAELTGDGAQPFASLLLASDSVLYGSTFYGGSYVTNGVNGTFFRLLPFPPPVTITSLSHIAAGTTLQFAGGAAGQSYQVQTTANPAAGPWQAIGSATAAVDGTFSFFDSTAPTQRTRFYRSAFP